MSGRMSFLMLLSSIFQLWDCLRTDNAHLVNRAHRIYNSHGGSELTGLAVAAPGSRNGGLMATSAEDGSVHITR